MLVVTDSPEQAEKLFPFTCSWSSLDRPRSTAAWLALEQGGASFATEADGPARTLLIVGRAPRSQFDQLQRIMRDGQGEHELAAIALEGDGFHGNRGRPWQAAYGNIHLCSMHCIDRETAFLKAGLSMVPTVAVAEALESLGEDLQPGIKWVNDVEIDQRKVCGTLTSTVTSGGRVQSVLFGIGINVQVVPQVEPTPFVPEAGALFPTDTPDLGRTGHVLLAVLDRLRARVLQVCDEGPDSLLESYTRYASILGQQVQVWEEEAGPEPGKGKPTACLAQGIAQGFDTHLRLYLEGQEKPVVRGRLARGPVAS